MKRLFAVVLVLQVFLFSGLVYAEKPLSIKIKQHCFSDPLKADTFKLLYNQTALTDTIYFQIISFQGKLIYSDKFPGLALFDYGKPSYKYYTKKGWKKDRFFKNKKDSLLKVDSLQKADNRYLLSKMESFFDEKHFLPNPLPKMLKEAKDNLIKGAYESLLNDSNVIGFSYHLYEEDGRMIAYSRKKNKAVLFWNCC